MSCDVGEVKNLGEWAELIVIVIAELILQAFSHFTYVTAHYDSPSFPSLHQRHSSFSNPYLALPTSQLILQPFRYFAYVTAHSPTLLSPPLRHRIFTYVTWRAAWMIDHNSQCWLQALCFSTHLTHNFLNKRCSVTILYNKEGEICEKWLLAQLMMNFDRRCALFIQKLYHRPHFTVGESWNKSLHLKSLQRFYCENSGSPASACVMRRHYSIKCTQ